MGSHSSHARLGREGVADASHRATSRSDGRAVSLSRPLALERKTVLCAGSDQATHRALKIALPGYEFVVAPTAYDTLRTAHTRVFDLYVLELWLSDWSGLSLARELRKVDPHAPMCFVASSVCAQDEARARKLGSYAIVLKPVDPDELRERVTRLRRAASISNKAAAEAACSALDHYSEIASATWPPSNGYIGRELNAPMTKFTHLS